MSATKYHPPDDETIAARLERSGVSRRNFLSFCGKLAVVAPMGLAITSKLTPEAIAATVGAAKRPSGHLAALAGVHRLHRIAAAHLASRPCDADPRPHLARLPRDALAASGHQAEPRCRTR